MVSEKDLKREGIMKRGIAFGKIGMNLGGLKITAESSQQQKDDPNQVTAGGVYSIAASSFLKYYFR